MREPLWNLIQRGCAVLLVGLPNVTVIGVGEWPHWLRIVVASVGGRPVCVCGTGAHRHGVREVVLVDPPCFGRATRLVVFVLDSTRREVRSGQAVVALAGACQLHQSCTGWRSGAPAPNPWTAARRHRVRREAASSMAPAALASITTVCGCR